MIVKILIQTIKVPDILFLFHTKNQTHATNTLKKKKNIG